MLNWIPTTVAQLPAVTQVLMGMWLLSLIGVPVWKWIWGTSAETWGVTASVLLQTATVLAILVPAWGTGRTVQTAVIVVTLGWLAEFIGSHTGFPFGRYAYTGRLQPQLGKVPLLIPLAWLMMLPPAWAVAATVTAPGARTLFVLVAALAFTAWDLFLDPQMVMWQMWVWGETGEARNGARAPHYFGIPWTNFAGWFAVAALVTWAATLPTDVTTALPVAPLLLIYGLTWFLESFGQFVFWGLPGSALSGGVGMGLCLGWAIWGAQP